MFDQVFDSLQKAAASAIEMQQETFKKWVSLWPGVTMAPATLGEPVKFQRKWAEAVGDTIKREREALEAQFSAALQNLEDAFRLAEAKDPEELRTKTIALWQKTFDCLRQAYEAQVREFQGVATRWAELVFKGKGAA